MNFPNTMIPGIMLLKHSAITKKEFQLAWRQEKKIKKQTLTLVQVRDLLVS